MPGSSSFGSLHPALETGTLGIPANSGPRGASLTARGSNELGDLQITGSQQLLFAPSPQALCAQIGLSWGQALDLYRDGFLSFSPALVDRLDEAQEAELRFVGALARTGCDRQLLSRMLRGLSYPYAYDLAQIYYDWETRTWRTFPQARGNPEMALTEWIDELVRANHADTLLGIIEVAQEALHRIGHKPPHL